MANLPVLGRNPSALTMSSREIAELVESRHDNVRRTMDTLQSKGLITITQTEEPTPGGGKPVTVYQVNKRDSYFASPIPHDCYVLNRAQIVRAIGCGQDLPLSTAELAEVIERASGRLSRVLGECRA